MWIHGKATVARTHAYGNKMAVAGAYSHGPGTKKKETET